MTEPDEIQFQGPVKPTNGGSRAARAGMVAGAAILTVVGVAAAMGANASPATGADPSANPSANPNPAASAAPGTVTPKGDRPAWRGLGPRLGGPGPFGGLGRFGFNDITITAIDGSSLSLRTDDGWTRTITVTDATKITKGGATIGVADLAVGDEVRIGQERAADGTYTVTSIVVVLPTVVGEITAIDGSTLTVTQRGGTTATIHVDGDTTYRVDGGSGSLSDLKVGGVIVAEGTQRSDGSLDASVVASGFQRRDGAPGRGWKGGPPVEPGAPASPAPSSGAS